MISIRRTQSAIDHLHQTPTTLSEWQQFPPQDVHKLNALDAIMHPYVRTVHIDDEFWWLQCQSPLMSYWLAQAQ